MNTSDYIAGCIAGKRKKDGQLYGGRVQWAGGVLYSYGSHYPLAWRLGNGWMVNDRGYSVTTAKHIGNARYAVRSVTGKPAVNVKLPRSSYYRSAADIALDDIPALRDLIAADVAEKLAAVKNSKRKNTRVYAWRRSDLREARANARRFERLAAEHSAPEAAAKRAAARLEYLRAELQAERLSYGDIAELQSLVQYIAPGDVELLEAAGVPEQSEDRAGLCMTCYTGHNGAACSTPGCTCELCNRNN